MHLQPSRERTLIHKGLFSIKHSGPIELQAVEVLGKPGQVLCGTAALCLMVPSYLFASKSLKMHVEEITRGIGHLLPLVPLELFLVLCIIFSFHSTCTLWKKSLAKGSLFWEAGVTWPQGVTVLLAVRGSLPPWRHGPTAAPAAPCWEAFVEKFLPLAASWLLVASSAC